MMKQKSAVNSTRNSYFKRRCTNVTKTAARGARYILLSYISMLPLYQNVVTDQCWTCGEVNK